MPSSNSIDWQIESIRVTLFVNGPLNPNKLETWLEEISGNLPLRVSKMPSSFDGVSESAAGFLSTKWIANRLDVILSSEESKDGKSIAPISEAASLFIQFVDRITEIGELALVDRIALGLKLIFEVPNDSEGIKVLSNSINGLELPESARDFLYRVNVPCKSRTVDGLNINRLAAWSVGHGKVIRVQINPDGSQEQQTIYETPTAIRLELDINTDQAVELGVNIEYDLLKELQTIAMDVALGGEATMRE